MCTCNIYETVSLLSFCCSLIIFKIMSNCNLDSTVHRFQKHHFQGYYLGILILSFQNCLPVDSCPSLSFFINPRFLLTLKGSFGVTGRSLLQGTMPSLLKCPNVHSGLESCWAEKSAKTCSLFRTKKQA